MSFSRFWTIVDSEIKITSGGGNIGGGNGPNGGPNSGGGNGGAGSGGGTGGGSDGPGRGGGRGPTRPGGGGGGGGNSINSPADLILATDYGMWGDLSNTSTLFTTSAGSTNVASASDPIGRIEDAAGGSVSVIQATAAARPLWGSSGLADFDGSDDGMTGALASKIFTSSGGCMAFAYTADSALTLDVVGSEERTITGFFRVTAYADTRSSPNRFANIGPDATDRYIDYPSAQSADTRVVIINQEAGTVRGYVNGTALASTVAWPAEFAGDTQIILGYQQAASEGNRARLNGKIFQFFYRNRTLSAAEIEFLTAYFSTKAGL